MEMEVGGGRWVAVAALDLNHSSGGNDWVASRLGRFTPSGKAFSTHCMGCGMDLCVSINVLEKRKINLPC